MQLSILSLFSRSPWGAIQEHMQQVSQCVDLLEPLIESVVQGDTEQTRSLAERIAKTENDADEIKNAIRDNLPRNVILPVAREDLLDILHVQDDIADAAEDVGIAASLCELDVVPSMVDPLRELCEAVRSTCQHYALVIGELDNLVEASFTGSQAKRVLGMLNEVAQLEDEADDAEAKVMRVLFQHDIEVGMRASAFHVWVEIIGSLGSVSNRSEKSGNRIRMFLAK